jgi:aldehyde:ferredoxin oxidoreductase
MMRWFNSQCGFTSAQDVLPERLFAEIPSGPQAGRQLPRADFYAGVSSYYQFAGWDEEGRPLPQTLRAISLGWLNEKGCVAAQL